MKHSHYLDEEAVAITESGARAATIRTVIGKKDGAPNFDMRVVSIGPGGQSPDHSHPWEHENFILNGRGTLEVEGEVVDLKPGDITFIPPNAHHCFRTVEGLELI